MPGVEGSARVTTYTLPVEYDKLSFAERAEVRTQYLRAQRGKCLHCHASLGGVPTAAVCEAQVNWSYFPDGFQAAPIHLHHSHTTGLTLGAVHMRCNAVLWQYHGK